jgi:hypothetical protein
MKRITTPTTDPCNPRFDEVVNDPQQPATYRDRRGFITQNAYHAKRRDWRSDLHQRIADAQSTIEACRELLDQDVRAWRRFNQGKGEAPRLHEAEGEE